MPLSYIPGLLKAELKGLSEDGYMLTSDTHDNFSVVTQLQTGATGGKWGGLSLSKMMIDANEARKHKKTPTYRINMIPKGQSSALYLIRSRNCNAGYFKVGKAKYIKKRLPQYKTALPLDNDLIVIAVLIVPSPALIVALEKALIANLRQWCVDHPTKLKPLRRTEWFRRMNGLGEALTIRTMINLGVYAAKTEKVELHLYGKTPWNDMLKLPNIGFTPRWDVINKEWKGLSPIERQLADAEEALVTDADDADFSKKELTSTYDVETNDVTFSPQS